MKTLLLLLIGLLAMSGSGALAQAGPSIPSWIRPGLTLEYSGPSAFAHNGTFSAPIVVTMETHVDAVGNGQVSATSQMRATGTPIASTIAWQCDALGRCRTSRLGFNGKFWVDPSAPTASAKGPNGEPFTIVGTGPYAIGGKTWTATTMRYQDPATGVKILLVFESRTGLILGYAETNRTEQVHQYLRSLR